jgi:hypothetical protein
MSEVSSEGIMALAAILFAPSLKYSGIDLS